MVSINPEIKPHVLERILRAIPEASVRETNHDNLLLDYGDLEFSVSNAGAIWQWVKVPDTRIQFWRQTDECDLLAIIINLSYFNTEVKTWLSH